MAIGWITILQTVPWAEVIKNAPKVAEGAKKLWNTVAKKPADSGSTVVETPLAEENEAPTLGQLSARVAALEKKNTELHGQMLASSELIRALAEQNTELIERVEAIRRRVLWLSILALILLLVAGANFFK